VIPATEDRIPSAFTIPLVLFLVGAALFAALLADQSFLIYLCVLVFTLAGGAKLWSRLSFARIRGALQVDKQKMFPGETLNLTIQAENDKLLPVWLQVRVGLQGALKSEDGSTQLEKDSGLLWFQKVSFNWELTALKRGVHRIGPLVFEVGDLLGFYPRQKKTADFHETVVYPRLVQLKRLPLPRRDFFGIPGVKSPIEDPVYIHGTRDYQHRRPARFIHWKASARLNRLMEKICEPAEQEKILIMVRVEHFSEDPTGESFERCLEAAASLAVELERRRYAVGVTTNGRLKGGGRPELKISRSPGQMADILETLARLEPYPAAALTELLQQGAALPWGITAVCLTCRFDAGALEVEHYFRRRRIPLVTIVCDAAAASQAAEAGRAGSLYRLEEIYPKGACP